MRSQAAVKWVLIAVAIGLGAWTWIAYKADTKRVEVDAGAPAVAPRPPSPAAIEPAEGTVEALGDLDLPPKRPEPVKESGDRGSETLQISDKKCAVLPKAFQARVVAPGQCEVYLHELTRQGDTIVIMASPKFGVRDNGRPVMTILAGSAYPSQ